MAATPTEVAHDVKVSTLDLGAEAKRAWGPTWGAPEVEYEFSNGRKYCRRTDQSAIYVTSPDFPA
jgi:hypothetical protein